MGMWEFMGSGACLKFPWKKSQNEKMHPRLLLLGASQWLWAYRDRECDSWIDLRCPLKTHTIHSTCPVLIQSRCICVYVYVYERMFFEMSMYLSIGMCVLCACVHDKSGNVWGIQINRVEVLCCLQQACPIFSWQLSCLIIISVFAVSVQWILNPKYRFWDFSPCWMCFIIVKICLVCAQSVQHDVRRSSAM